MRISGCVFAPLPHHRHPLRRQEPHTRPLPILRRGVRVNQRGAASLPDLTEQKNEFYNRPYRRRGQRRRLRELLHSASACAAEQAPSFLPKASAHCQSPMRDIQIIDGPQKWRERIKPYPLPRLWIISVDGRHYSVMAITAEDAVSDAQQAAAQVPSS